jgi:hypothetical protein
MKRKIAICLCVTLFLVQHSIAGTYYVSTTGNDASGNGSSASPWKTLLHAVSLVPAGLGNTIQLGAGTFVENGLIAVPLGVNIAGAGMTLTILKSSSSFYYHPANPGYATDQFLISLSSSGESNGNQSLTDFMIDGDSKQLHGGIYVYNRDNVTINQVTVQYTNFTGIWLWNVTNSKIENTTLVNCSWGSTAYCSGSLNLGNLSAVEITHLNVNENTGYGIKAIGPSGNNNILTTTIHDSHISVNPVGLWGNGTTPNIAIELWQINLVGCAIYNTYVDNTISLVNSNAIPSTGIQTIRVYNDTLDMETRALGAGYGMELSINDAEIDHNYFIKGTQGIANWSSAMKNWSIHHNIFYAIQGIYPGEVVRSQISGLHNVNLYNNTIEFASNETMNVVGLYGGTSENVNIENNLVINNNTGYSFYPNSLVHMENSAILNTLAVKNNLLFNLPIGTVPGTYSNNLTSDPLISKTDPRPYPYYMPMAGSPLIDAGLNVGYPYLGLAPDIGAYEYAGTLAPVVSITSPTNNATFTTGASIPITANAIENGGTISKVEFYNGTTLLGQALTSPYSFTWTNVPAGNYSLTAKATDNAGVTTFSVSVTVMVSSPPAIELNLDSSEATLTGLMTTGYDTQAQLGNFFYVPPGNGQNYYIPPPASAVFNFQIANTDTYWVWARIKSPVSPNQGFYIYNGNGSWFTWLAGIYPVWTWVKIANGSATALYLFNQGANQFQMGWDNENVQVDQITITNDSSYVPPANPIPPLTLYPNPAGSQFTIQYTSSVSQQAQVSVFSLGNVLVKQTMVQLQAGLNNIPVTTEYIYNGTYIVVFQPSSGASSSARLIIYR